MFIYAIWSSWLTFHDGLFWPKMLQVVEIYRFIYIYQSLFVWRQYTQVIISFFSVPLLNSFSL